MRRNEARLTLCWACLLGLPVAAQNVVELGPADGIALDQPRVAFALLHPGTDQVVGPQIYNTAALDTAANGILLARLAYASQENYGQAQRGQTPVYYDERGLAATQPLAVLPPYDLLVQADQPTEGFKITRVHALASESMDLGSFAGVVGMPVMAGRVVVLDLKPLAQLELMGVRFSDAPPQPGPRTHDIVLGYMPPEHTGQRNPADPLPTYHGLPLVAVELLTPRGKWSGQFVLDTGAQSTFISPAVAQALRLDLEKTVADGGDVLMYLPTTGVGGLKSVPLVRVGRLTLPTRQGALVWTSVVAGIQEIPRVDGVFGINLLTSGYAGQALGVWGAGAIPSTQSTKELQTMLNELGLDGSAAGLASLGGLVDGLLGGAQQPFFETVVLDFRSPQSWQMRLDLWAPRPVAGSHSTPSIRSTKPAASRPLPSRLTGRAVSLD